MTRQEAGENWVLLQEELRFLEDELDDGHIDEAEFELRSAALERQYGFEEE